MSFTIYALRLKGSTEARYIGQTGHTAEHRLKNLAGTAWHMPVPTPLSVWLMEHGAEVECLVLALVATREDALRLEREAISFALALGHRLFNRQHVPTHLKIGDSPEIVARRHAWMTTGIRQRAA